MKVKDLKNYLDCFSNSSEIRIDYVPAVFEFSHAPANPSICYVAVEVDYELDEETAKYLKESGWNDETDAWVYYC